MANRTPTSLPDGALLASPGHLDSLANQLEEIEMHDDEFVIVPSPNNPRNLEENYSPNTTMTEPSPAARAAAEAAAASANRNSTIPAPPPDPSTKRKSPPGSTTARQQKKKKASVKIKLGARVYSTRKQLYLCGRLDDDQKKAIQGFPDTYRLYGKVVTGKGTTGYNVKYDLLPAGKKMVKAVLRSRMTVLVDGAEEPAMPSSVEEQAEIEAAAEAESKKRSPFQKSLETFKALSPLDQSEAKLYEMYFGTGEDDKIEWEILPDGLDERLNLFHISSSFSLGCYYQLAL